MAIPSSYSVVFNEIMYNLEGSDTNREWIEIYNDENQSVNLTGWKFIEGIESHNLKIITKSVLMSGEFAVIVQDNETFLNDYPNFSGILIDSLFTLTEAGKTLVLKNKTGYVADNVTYSSSVGGNGNGMSVGKHKLTWNETRPTPGYENIVPEFCDWKVSIISNWSYDDSSEFKIYTEKLRGNPTNVTITKRVEDLNGNLIKSYDNSTSKISTHNTLTYGPNFPTGAYLIKSSIFPSCEDVDLENNFAEKMIYVKSSETPSLNTTTEDEETKSSLSIEEIYDLGTDEKAQFGQVIRAKIVAYRGNTAKYSISVGVEGEKAVSKDFKFNVNEKYSTVEFTIPIQITANCKNQFENGTYKIIAEGLGEKTEEKIKIYGNAKDSCIVMKETVEKIVEKKVIVEEKSKSEETLSSKQSFNYARPYAVSTILFESSQKRAEELVPYIAGTLAATTALFLFFFKTPV